MENYYEKYGFSKDYNKQKSFLFLKIEEAHKEIQFMREHDRVISAWIDVFDENNVKQTVFHECYIDVFGNMCK